MVESYKRGHARKFIELGPNHHKIKSGTIAGAAKVMDNSENVLPELYNETVWPKVCLILLLHLL